MMTEAQVEAAARELCRLRGEDPDASVGHSRAGSLAWYYSKAWTLAADEIRARDQIDEAMRVGRESPADPDASTLQRTQAEIAAHLAEHGEDGSERLALMRALVRLMEKP